MSVSPKFPEYAEIVHNGEVVSDSNPLPTSAIAGSTSAATIADGADVNAGSTTDAAVTTNAAGTLSGKLRGLVAIFANVWNSALAALRVQAGGYSIQIWTNFTRPNDVNAYTPGDAITTNTTAGSAANLTFANIVRNNGQGGMITRASLISTNNAAAPGSFILNLFKVAPATQADNAAGAFTDAELQGGNYLGSILFVLSNAPNPAAGTLGNRVYRAENLSLSFAADAASTSIFGVLQADSAYTPIAQERFDVGLFVEQN